MTTLSPFLIGLPRSSVSASAVRRMWASGVCQRMISGTMLAISSGLARSFWYWSGILFSAYTAPEIELRVVSLPPTISRIRLPRNLRSVHVPRGVAVRQHRDQVVLRRLVDPLVPELREVLAALLEDHLLLVEALDQAGAGDGGGDVGPVGQLAAVLEREVEQRRQHLRRQLDRDLVHPVERLAERQLVEDLARPLADGDGELVEMGRRERSAPRSCAARRASAGPSR